VYFLGVFCDSDWIVPKGKPTLVPLAKLRRIALDCQGLLQRAPFGRGKNATLKAIERLGYVQIDTISVVNRAHHHVLATRVPNYQPSHLDRLQGDGSVFEYWYHAAAYLPMRHYRFALPRMQGFRDGTEHWMRCRDTRLMQRVLDHVRAEGPTQSRDFEMPEPRRNAGWWDWKPTKRALEQLFMQGDLMVAGRRGFQKTYDLTERILPSDVDTRHPLLSEQAAHLVDNTLTSHGFATAKSFTHLRRNSELRAAVRAELDARTRDGSVVVLALAGQGTWYAHAEILDSRAPPATATVRILSPFDNALILRHRTEALFEFDYQLECYVTESKRAFGYFCLPVLYRDRFVGRADCKAHRCDAHFEIKHLFIEHADLVDDGFPTAFARAMARFANVNGCTTTYITRTTPQTWHRILTNAVESGGPLI